MAYVWLIDNARLSLVSTYAYVNPVVAVVLGILLHGDNVSDAQVLGGAIVVVGVGKVVTAKWRSRAQPSDLPELQRDAHPSRDHHRRPAPGGERVVAPRGCAGTGAACCAMAMAGLSRRGPPDHGHVRCRGCTLRIS